MSSTTILLSFALGTNGSELFGEYANDSISVDLEKPASFGTLESLLDKCGVGTDKLPNFLKNLLKSTAYIVALQYNSAQLIGTVTAASSSDSPVAIDSNVWKGKKFTVKVKEKGKEPKDEEKEIKYPNDLNTTNIAKKEKKKNDGSVDFEITGDDVTKKKTSSYTVKQKTTDGYEICKSTYTAALMVMAPPDGADLIEGILSFKWLAIGVTNNPEVIEGETLQQTFKDLLEDQETQKALTAAKAKALQEAAG